MNTSKHLDSLLFIIYTICLPIKKGNCYTQATFIFSVILRKYSIRAFNSSKLSK